MQISSRRRGEVGILELSGDLESSADVGAFYQAVREFVASGGKNALVDLHGVGYMSSPGLGAIVSGMASVCEAGGRLKLLSPGERVRKLFAITRLTELFEIFEDEESGVASFAGG